ncbi:MAG: hypothetical protein PHI19_07490 [Clostridia bacterium]|nr:hypothetical protein [Clostridia bacterium]
MNPFEQKPLSPHKFMDWKTIYPESYDKNATDPYSKIRVILINGAEFEQVWFLHQFFRHETNNDIRREIALVRRTEQQQQKRIACLKPLNESILEHTIGYEQLAVDLTSELAQREKDMYVKQALDFALLEDFDHLYRYADLLEMEYGVLAEKLVGNYTEIMPGRPTISEHRHPYDDVKRFTNYKVSDPITKLNVGIITAAEQQTMNYYMNVCNLYTTDIGRKLYQEIGMIEEQHVTTYGGLMDTTCTWLESWLEHEYTECYLYYSCMMNEPDKMLRKVYEQHFEKEVGHLHLVANLLEKYEKKHWSQVIPVGEFPQLLVLKSNKDYVRNVLNTVKLTGYREDYKEVSQLPKDAEFFDFQKQVNTKLEDVASHKTIDNYIKKNGKDYRFEDGPHPVRELKSRTVDNTTLARQ